MDNFYTSGIFAALSGFLIIFILLIVAFSVVSIIASWKLFKKAGKQGWETIVPIYGYYVLTEIAGLNWWWFLLAIANSIVSIIGLNGLSAIASLVSLFATFNIYYNIAKKFNKDTTNAVLAGIFSGIFVLIFGFSKKEVYNASIPVSKNGVFGQPEMTDNNNFTNNNNNINNNNFNNTNVRYCQFCGISLNGDEKYCRNCGTEIKK